MISSISSLEITYVAIPDPKSFFRIAVSVAAAAAVNPNGIKILLASVFSTSFIKGKFLVTVFEIYLQILRLFHFMQLSF